MEIKIKSFSYNPMYDPSKLNNGGGYLQPGGEAVVVIEGIAYDVYVDDTSCGDFGERISIKVVDIANSMEESLCLNEVDSDAQEHNFSRRRFARAGWAAHSAIVEKCLDDYWSMRDENE